MSEVLPTPANAWPRLNTPFLWSLLMEPPRSRAHFADMVRSLIDSLYGNGAFDVLDPEETALLTAIPDDLTDPRNTSFMLGSMFTSGALDTLDSETRASLQGLNIALHAYADGRQGIGREHPADVDWMDAD